MSADTIVKELFIENAKLMSMINGLQTQIDRSSIYNSMWTRGVIAIILIILYITNLPPFF